MLIADCDLLLLQETLLPDHALDQAEDLRKYNDEIDFFFTPATRPESSFRGRSSGGLGLIWKKSLTPHIKNFPFSARIMGVAVQFANESFLLLNVYLPYDNPSNREHSLREYQNVMADLSAICQNERATYDHVILCGDWNADPYAYNSRRFYRELTALTSELSLTVVDVATLPKQHTPS